MSYAGTYGPDETCRHDRYWRSCADCSEVGPRATAEQSRKARERRLAAAAEADAEAERISAERHEWIVVRDGFGRIVSETPAPTQRADRRIPTVTETPDNDGRNSGGASDG